MKKSKLLLNGLFLAAVVAGLGYMVFFSNTNSSYFTEFTGTMPQLKRAGSEMRCTFEHVNQTVNMKGTVYMDEGHHMRLDSLVSTMVYGELETFVIMDDIHSYTWGTLLANSGIKKVMAPYVESDIGVDDPENDFDNIHFFCERWEVDETYFELPEDIIFEDFEDRNREAEMQNQDIVE